MKKSSLIVIGFGALATLLSVGCGGTGEGGDGMMVATTAMPGTSTTVSTPTSTGTTAPATSTPPTATTGMTAPAKLPSSFAVCSACHGPEGEGNSIGPDLRHVDSGYFDWIVRKGKSGTSMVAFSASNFSDADMAASKAYLSAFPLPSDGAGLYKDLCSSCHGPTGSGKGSIPAAKGAPDVSGAVRSGKGGSNFGGTEYMPAFSAAALPDAQLKLIVDFLK